MAVLRILRDPWVGGIIGLVAAALIFVFAGRVYVAFRTPHWIAQLRDPDPGERRIAALYLNEFAQPTDAVLRAFMTAMEDRHVGVRQQAAAGLAKFGSAGRPAVPLLLEALNDEDYSVRSHAARALKHIGYDPTLHGSGDVAPANRKKEQAGSSPREE